MYIGIEQIVEVYTRKSKTGIEHNYTRKSSVVILRCDNCGVIFQRPKRKMSPKRLSNNYFHCCSECDSKKFAQRKGVEQKKIWDMPASVDLPVGKF